MSALPSRWVVVADSPFLPARAGGDREHLGFVTAAARAGLVAALVLPVDLDPAAHGRADDLEAIARLVAPAPILTVPRRRSPLAALTSRRPYVVASRPAPADLVDRVRAAAPQADGIVVFSYKVSGIGQVLAEGLGVPAVLRTHNLEGVYHHSLADSAAAPASWAIRLEAARIEADERRLERSGWLAGIADISAADAAVREVRATVPVAFVPPFALAARKPGAGVPWRPPATPTVVFLGALDVATNVDALRWFAREVWPSVRLASPYARWHVVGRNPGLEVQEVVATTAGASLHADVADPDAYLRAASVAVNPAVSGSGVNIKIVDYLAIGVPVVSTTRGVAGLGLAAGQDVLTADQPADFAAAVVNVLHDPDRAARLGATGHRTALRLLDTEANLHELRRMFRGAGAPAPRPRLVGLPSAQSTTSPEVRLLDRVEVVVVSYRSAHHVAALLQSWPADLRVVVVDNARGADGLDALAAQHPNVRYVLGPGEGFSRAANLGAVGSDREFLVFVNPDSRPTPESIEALVAGLVADSRAAGHAATTLRSDGRVEAGVGGWRPSVRRAAVHAIGLHKLLRDAGLFAQPRPAEPVSVDWVSGAVMAVRASTFRALGGFDESFFVYAEDVAFGSQAQAAGLRLVLREDVVVPHDPGESGAPSAEMLQLRGASYVSYLRRYHDAGEALAIRAVFAAGTAGRAVLLALLGRTGSARLSLAMLRGLVTARAYVGGVEVAQSRLAEIESSAS